MYVCMHVCVSGEIRMIYLYPTSCPSFTFISCDTLAATDMAATLLGCVQPILPSLLQPASCRY